MTDRGKDRDFVDRVRDAADIVSVIGDTVRLKKKGRTWEGLCPFHEEKTPSFSVDPVKGVYYCFGCHAGGDVFRFVMDTENASFPEALERLARMFGVPIPEADPQARQRRSEADRLRTILEEAQAVFVETLMGPEGQTARAELERRGFPSTSWSAFGFGWTPDAWRHLVDRLGRRHTEGNLVKAGLAVVSDNGGSAYDRFRQRITFPIRAPDGRLVAFGGRILGEGEPKYLNSPEGPLFHKRSTLFSLDRARRPIARSGQALVVEGYFDCLSLHRVGFDIAVATLGTALTAEHARVLRRLIGDDGSVLLCYDADAAGRRAAAAGAQVLLQAGVEARIVTIEGGKDPDDVIRDGGVEAFQRLVERPLDLLDFLLADLPGEPSERRRAGLALAPLVCSASHPAIRRNLVEELARRLHVSPAEVVEQGRVRRMGDRSGGEAGAEARSLAAVADPGERALVRLLLEGSRDTRFRAIEDIRPAFIRDGRVRELLERAAENPEADLLALVEREPGADDGVRVLVLQVLAGSLPPVDDANARAMLEGILRRQRRLEGQELQAAIDRAAADGDTEELRLLLERKMELKRQAAERKSP
jgi:DNA primase